MSGGRPLVDRRDRSPAGVWNRDKFEASLGLLHALGLPLRLVEYYRARARRTGRLPHEIVADVVKDAAPGGDF